MEGIEPTYQISFILGIFLGLINWMSGIGIWKEKDSTKLFFTPFLHLFIWYFSIVTDNTISDRMRTLTSNAVRWLQLAAISLLLCIFLLYILEVSIGVSGEGFPIPIPYAEGAPGGQADSGVIIWHAPVIMELLYLQIGHYGGLGAGGLFFGLLGVVVDSIRRMLGAIEGGLRRLFCRIGDGVKHTPGVISVGVTNVRNAVSKGVRRSYDVGKRLSNRVNKNLISRMTLPLPAFFAFGPGKSGTVAQDRDTRTIRRWPVPEEKLPDPNSVTGPPSAPLKLDDRQQLEPIDEGGNAKIYRTIEQIDGERRRIAIKSHGNIQETVRNETTRKITNEAEIWQQLDDHPHIVGVVDYGQGSPPWIAMEYMDGGSLQNRIDEEGPLPIPEALWVGRCIARAIHHGHKQHVGIHQDIKPANVLYRETRSDTWDVPKLADWGLAVRLIEHSGGLDGRTLPYAAPEQVESELTIGPGEHTDIYQLGATLYHLLTGDPPYKGPATESRIANPNTEPPPPSELRDEVSDEIDAVILAALEHDPDGRYETVAEFRRALQALQAERDSPLSLEIQLDDGT